MKESTAYKRIIDIMRNSCDLTAEECYYLRGRLVVHAEKVAETSCHAETA